MTELRFDRLTFTGGDLILQIGSLNDLLCFFNIIEKYAAPSLDDTDRQLVLDRLYKRYLRIDETPVAVEAMRRVQNALLHVPTSSVNWDNHHIKSGQTTFDLQEGTVAGAVSHFFKAFPRCAESTMYCNNQATHRFFRPVKICRSDFGSLDREDRRPLEEYDALDGPPFWLAKT